MPPPKSPEKAKKTTTDEDELTGSKTTVYLAPRASPTARQELVALRCVRSSDDDNSLTYLPELRDLTPEADENEFNTHWGDKPQDTKAVRRAQAPSMQSEASSSDVKQRRLAYESETPTIFKELRKVTPPHNTNLEVRKQKLMGSTTDIVSKGK